MKRALVACVACVACSSSAPPPKPPDAGPAVASKPLTPPPPADPVDHAATLLGGEHGLDHVGIAVKDLDAATHTYHDLLGFSKPTEGKLPNGLRNVNYYFADSSYLETLVWWDRTKADWLAAFTDKHEGGLFAVLAAWSPETSTAFLAKRGIAASAPFSGTLQGKDDAKMPDEKWKTFFLPPGTLAGDPIYFIAYPRAKRDDFLAKLRYKEVKRLFYHDNTVLGTRAVWIAVPKLDEAVASYQKIGLAAGRAFTDAELGAEGRVIEAGAGEIWVMAPTSPTGKVGAFLKDRGPGVFGVTLYAGNLAVAAQLIASRTGRPMPTSDGIAGARFRVPPELTHGVWLEFAQYLAPKQSP